MQEIAPQNLVVGQQYQIRGRPGSEAANTSYWGNFAYLSNSPFHNAARGGVLSNPGAVFSGLEPPFLPARYNHLGSLWPPLRMTNFPHDLYSFHGENPVPAIRRGPAIKSHANNSGISMHHYAGLSSNRPPVSRKNRRTRRNRKQMSRRR
jgi:hypothetical protein